MHDRWNIFAITPSSPHPHEHEMQSLRENQDTGDAVKARVEVVLRKLGL